MPTLKEIKSRKFKFTPQNCKQLAEDLLSPPAIADLERALSVPKTEVLPVPDDARMPTLARKLLREVERRGWQEPESFVRALRRLGTMDVGERRAQRAHKRRKTDPSFRRVIESLTLRVCRKHGLKLGGPRAARVLAIVLRQKLGINVGTDPDGQHQHLMRARRALASWDPLTDPELRLDYFLGEWAALPPLPR